MSGTSDPGTSLNLFIALLLIASIVAIGTGPLIAERFCAWRAQWLARHLEHDRLMSARDCRDIYEGSEFSEPPPHLDVDPFDEDYRDLYQEGLDRLTPARKQANDS